jgi:hypothetical protein|nr:MAG TPA: Structural protein [Caudoviricetes sp.]
MNLKSQLKNIDVTKLKFKNGKTYGQVMVEETNRLRNCIQARLDAYMNSYQPKIYSRTGALQNSLKVDDILNLKVTGKTMSLDIYFDDSGYHRSGDGIQGWDGNGETVNTAYLLNYGYEVEKDVWFKDIPNFGYRSAGHFIENGIADFEASNPYGIKIKVHKPDGYNV